MQVTFRREDGTTLTFGTTNVEVIDDHGFFNVEHDVIQFSFNKTGWAIDGIPGEFQGFSIH